MRFTNKNNSTGKITKLFEFRIIKKVGYESYYKSGSRIENGEYKPISLKNYFKEYIKNKTIKIPEEFYKEIAKELNLRPYTVKKIYNTYIKMCVKEIENMAYDRIVIYKLLTLNLNKDLLNTEKVLSPEEKKEKHIKYKIKDEIEGLDKNEKLEVNDLYIKIYNGANVPNTIVKVKKEKIDALAEEILEGSKLNGLILNTDNLEKVELNADDYTSLESFDNSLDNDDDDDSFNENKFLKQTKNLITEPTRTINKTGLEE